MRLSQSAWFAFLLMFGVLSSNAAEAGPYCIDNRTDKSVTAVAWEEPPGFGAYLRLWSIDAWQSKCEDSVFFNTSLKLNLRMLQDNFECVVPLDGDGKASINAKDRLRDFGVDVPLLYCESEDAAGTVIDEPFWKNETQTDGPRSVRFLGTADPQYSGGAVNDGIANRTLATMRGLLDEGIPPRGIVVAGDLTSSTRGREIDAYIKALSGAERHFYDGLGNHDFNLEEQAICSEGSPCQAKVLEFVLNRKRATVLTKKADDRQPHYSWDWADVHFVQLNLMPSDRRTADPFNRLDPLGALTFLQNDLAENVGHSGRPVIVIHHYGFDPQISLEKDPVAPAYFDPVTQKNVFFDKWWDEDQRNKYWEALANYNTVALITGHWHAGVSDARTFIDWERPDGLTTGPLKILDIMAGSAHGDDSVARDSAGNVLLDSEGNAVAVQVPGAFTDIRISGDWLIAQRRDDTGASESLRGVAYPSKMLYFGAPQVTLSKTQLTNANCLPLPPGTPGSTECNIQLTANVSFPGQPYAASTPDVTYLWKMTGCENTNAIALGTAQTMSVILLRRPQDCTIKVTVTNAYNGKSTTAEATFVYDTSAPTITGYVTPEPTVDGWNKTGVDVSWACEDPETGIASCQPSARYENDGAASVTGLAVNNVGITGSGSVAVRIDKVPPQLNVNRSPGSGNAYGWNNTDVKILTLCVDALSGIKPGDCPVNETLSTDGVRAARTYTVSDLAGNTASDDLPEIKIDKTRPTLIPHVNPAPTNGWNNTDVDITWTCSDNGSGVDGNCPSFERYTSGVGVTIIRSIADKAGNLSDPATGAVTFSIDKVPPSVTANRSPAAGNAYGWNNTDVKILALCADSLSGILDPGDCPVNETLSTDGVRPAKTYTVSDRAGNTASDDLPEIKIDKTKPSISGLATPGPNANGWNNSSVVISWSCSDNLSGIDGDCPPPSRYDNDGAAPVTSQISDKAGNTFVSAAIDVNIDTRPPSLGVNRSPASGNAYGWNNTDVKILTLCADSLSGIKPGDCPVNEVVSTDGVRPARTYTVSDLAGNSASDDLPEIKIDKTAPTFTFVPPPVTVAQENGSGATYVLSQLATATDALSGVVAIDVSGVPDNNRYPAGATTITFVAHDAAGNSSTATTTVTVRDTTAPVVTAPAGLLREATGPNGTAVDFTASANDNVSGALDVTCTPASASTFAIRTTPVTCRATDAAGNTGSASFNVTVSDTAPPTLSVADVTVTGTNPAVAGAAAAFSPIASDSVGVVSVVCTPASGTLFPFGKTTVSCTAADAAGNATGASFAVTVLDGVAPVVTVPANIVRDAANANGAVVTFVSSASDNVTTPIASSCSPVSGSTFAIGITTVTCTATDAAHNTGSASFSVTVEDVTTPGEMNGDGFIRTAAAKSSFEFRVIEKVKNDLERGRFSLNVDYAAKNMKSDRFEAGDVTFIAFSDDPTIRPGRSRRPQVDTVRFSGVGAWNGKAGYLFEVLASDEGEPGRHRESVSIVVRSPAGAVVAQVDGELSGGNVQSRRIHR